MKYTSLLIILFPLLTFSQFDEIETVEKSAFPQAEFGGGHSIKILNKLLKEDSSFLTKNIIKVKIKAIDLYYKMSQPYDYTMTLDKKFHFDYLITKKEKINQLDSVLKSNRWKTHIIENNLLEEILESISYGSKISIENDVIYLSQELPTKKKTFIRKFKFDDDKKLVFKGYGYTINKNDTLFWKQTTYQYEKNVLSKEIRSLYRDYSYRELILKESETIIYQNGKIKKITKHFINKKNEKNEEEVTEYFYKRGKIISSTTNTFHKRNDFKESIYTGESSYKKTKLVTINEVGSNFRKSDYYKTSRKNKYDKKNRLIFSSYKANDKDGNKMKTSTIEIEYKPNNYIYTYKEDFIIRRGEKRLPLQYKMSFTFLND